MKLIIKFCGKYCATSRHSIGFARKSKRRIWRLHNDGADIQLNNIFADGSQGLTIGIGRYN